MDNQILLVGTGALATLFACRLSAAGIKAGMLGTWPAGLEALNRQGARLLGPDGMEDVFQVQASAQAEDFRNVRLALVLVKAWQTERAAEQLTRCLAADGLAVTLQNGLGNYEILARTLGRRRVALGVTTTGATLLGPGLVRPGGEGTISLEIRPGIDALESLLRQAGFKIEMVKDARSLAWGKVVINAAINPVTALLRAPNGVLLERPEARWLMSRLAREAAAVATAEGIRLPYKDPVGAAREVARRTAANYSSMLQDVRRGARTEIDAICGAVVRTGKAHGIDVPANQVCWQLIRALSPT